MKNKQLAHQKLDYIHENPIESGFVLKAEDWKYSSAIEYFGGKCLLEIFKLENLVFNKCTDTLRHRTKRHICARRGIRQL